MEHLCSLPRETEWLEFKHNWFEQERVGKYISALSNSAILASQKRAFLVFGVDNDTRSITGTTVRLKDKKVGNQDLELWLGLSLSPRIHCVFEEFEYDDKHIEIIIIEPAHTCPVKWKNEAFVRVGSSNQKLQDHPERERSIWLITSRNSFEDGIAAMHVSPVNIFDIVDCAKLFQLLNVNITTENSIIDHLKKEKLITDDFQGGFDVSNLLILLAANDLRQYTVLVKKAPRVIEYKGNSKITGTADRAGRYGYGIAFSNLVSYIMDRVPHREEMKHGKRTTVYTVQEIIIREILANALIHQDFLSEGDGPLIEIYSNRISITNPGKPLISPEYFINAPPKSRNEKLAGFMRRMNICEERGSGIDRVIDAIESAKLAPPSFNVVESSTTVTIFFSNIFSEISKEDCIRACYQHACLQHAKGTAMTEVSLRERFGLHPSQYSRAPTIIKDAIAAGKIRALDDNPIDKKLRYVPSWA